MRRFMRGVGLADRRVEDAVRPMGNMTRAQALMQERFSEKKLTMAPSEIGMLSQGTCIMADSVFSGAVRVIQGGRVALCCRRLPCR